MPEEPTSVLVHFLQKKSLTQKEQGHEIRREAGEASIHQSQPATRRINTPNPSI
jgi:hypothetical protein